MAAAGRPEAAGDEAPGAPLLLWAPAAPGPGFADELAAVLATGTVAALVAPTVAAADWRATRQACREAGVAFLVGDDLGIAQALAADGVHLLEAARVPGARGLLGAGALIGAACGRSRHEAMIAGEDGADYVTFTGDAESVAELCAWWADLFTLPCCADLRGTDAADLPGLVSAGADLVAVDEAAVWSRPEGAEAACRGLGRRVDEARAGRGGEASSGG